MASPASSTEGAQSKEKTSPCEDSPDLQDGNKSYKRRRISRACDDCRRKKIKCDGKQPCSSCAEFNSKCTYQNPAKRNKSTPPNELETLRARLHVAESLIRDFLPHVDLQRLESIAISSQQTVTSGTPRDDASASGQETITEPSSESAKYIPLVENSEQQLRLTGNGEFDFQGHSSGAAFLSRITQHFPGLLRYDSRIPFLPEVSASSLPSPAGLPSLGPFVTGQSNYDFSKLPPRELARMLCEYSFNHASCLLRIVHVPSFYQRFDEVYDKQPRTYTQDEIRYLGLLYSVLALGSMYDVDENDPSNPDHYNEAMNRGYKFYLGARVYIRDLAECRDLTTLQAILFIIQFLQAMGNLSSCYNLIGIALRSALRMGLHRHIFDPRMTPIESETRKRVFHTTRQMDIYLSTTLGLPIVLQNGEIDQPLPTAIDDNHITRDALLQPSDGKPSITEAFNAHAKLMEILALVVECVYPSRSAVKKATHTTYMINFNRLQEVEQKLHSWYQQLPTNLRPGNNGDVHLHRVQILLRFAYAHVQMMLYRPFMQYLNHQGSLKESPNDRYQTFAAAGISVCRNIISIGLEIRKQAALIGPYWFITYTQFFAVLCLTFHVSHNPDKPESSDILTDAVLGKESISGLNQRSLAADRLSAALESVFDHLPQPLRSQIQNIKGRLPLQPRAHGAEDRPIHSQTSSNSSPAPLSTTQRQWQIPQSTTIELPNLGRSMDFLRSSQPTQAPLHHIGADRIMFPLEDPIAYPSASGIGSTSNESTSTCEDTMQLVVPDFFGDMSGTPIQPFDTAQTSHDPSSHPLPSTLHTGYPQFLEDPIARIFDDLETTDIWSMPQSRS